MKHSRIMSTGLVAFVAVGLLISGAVAVAANTVVRAPMDPAKQQFLALEKARQDTANALPHAVKHPEQLPASSCPHAITPGVHPFRMAPFHGGKNLVNEVDVVSTAGVGYTLCTGALDNDPSQGVVVVLAGTDPCAAAAGTAVSYLKAFPTPIRNGAVRAIVVQGDLLRFITAGGRSGVFDFVTGRYSP